MAKFAVILTFIFSLLILSQARYPLVNLEDTTITQTDDHDDAPSFNGVQDRPVPFNPHHHRHFGDHRQVRFAFPCGDSHHRHHYRHRHGGNGDINIGRRHEIVSYGHDAILSYERRARPFGEQVKGGDLNGNQIYVVEDRVDGGDAGRVVKREEEEGWISKVNKFLETVGF